MSASLRVLHLIDQLTDGGSQRWVWDLVRLSDPSILEHRVVPLMLDRGDFVYADRLANARVYRHSIFRPLLKRLSGATGNLQTQAPEKAVRRSIARTMWHGACFGRASLVLPTVVAAYRPHVIHAHTFDSVVAALALRRIFRVPLIHTVPALFTQMEDLGGGWLSELYRKRHSEIALFFTGASRSDLQAAGVPENKVRWIEGVVDVRSVADVTNRRTEHRAAVRKEIGAPDDAPVVLSVGRLHRSKGNRYALEALPLLLKRHPDLHWIVLGIGPELSELQESARRLGVAERAHFLGFQNDPLPYYAAADLYLRTPIYEAENLCSYQAMAAGIAVVGFDTGIETELLSSVGHGALVENRNSHALGERAADILSLSDRGRSLGSRGLEYARDHLDIHRAIDDYTAGYLSVGKHASAGEALKAATDAAREAARDHP